MTSKTPRSPINLTANDLVVGAPVLGTPALSQNHIPLPTRVNNMANVTFEGAGGLRIVEEGVFIIPAKRNEPCPPPAPPKWAEFALVVFAKSKRNQAAVGDLCEMYVQDCAQYGSSRARLRFWARTGQFLLGLLVRALGRVIKVAVLLDAIKRYLVG
jgi:hypothetical protein